MALTEKYIEKVRVGSSASDDHVIAAKYLTAIDVASTDSGYKTWKDILNLVNTAKVKFLICSTAANTPKGVTFTPKGSSTQVTGTLEASAGDVTTFYLVYHPHTTTTGTTDAYDEYVVSGTGTSAAWEKIGNTDIDLSNVAKKGTYNTSGPNPDVTGSGGAQTANGTATVTYSKASNATGSAGGAIVSGSNFTFTGTKATLELSTDYTPAGTISKPGVNLGGKTSITYATGSAKSGGTATAITGYPNFSGGSASGTFVTSAIKNVNLDNTATSTTTGAVKFVEAITGSAPSLTGTKTFNTDAIKSVTLSDDATSTTGPTYVQSVSGTFVTGVKANASVGGTKNYGFSASTSNVMTAPTVSSAGVLSWTLVDATTQDAHSMTQMTFNTGGVSATTKYMKATGVAAGTGTVGIQNGSYSATTKYLTASGDAAATGSVSWTAAALGTPNTATVIKSDGLATSTFDNYTSASLAATPVFTGTAATLELSTDYTPTGTIGGSQTINGHTHSITLTATEITGTASVAVSNHTHSLSNHTHSVTIPGLN